MSTRRPTLGAAGGFALLSSDQTTLATDPAAPVLAKSPLHARAVGFLVAAMIRLASNGLLWYCLLEVPPFKDMPPVVIGVAGIFANFYLLPFARNTGRRLRRQIESAKADPLSPG